MRTILLAWGLVCLLIAVALVAWGAAPLILIAYLLANGAGVIAAVLLERRGYRPKVDRSRGQWELTGERFVDPSSGHLIEVLYNPQTGQRDYADTERKPGDARS